MFDFLNPLREMTTLTVGLRMILAVILGAVIGLERSSKNRPAGFRTHTLVCLGAAVAAMTGLFIVLKLGMLSDVSRISAQVISGLGFIIAGTIVVTKKRSIKGLTTAASICPRLWARPPSTLTTQSCFSVTMRRIRQLSAQLNRPPARE